MAQFKKRMRRELPRDKVFLAGYDQGYLDVSNAILSYFEQMFMEKDANGRPVIKKGSPEYRAFLDGVRLVSAELKAERKKAEERVNGNDLKR